MFFKDTLFDICLFSNYRFTNTSIANIIRLVAPDVLVFMVSLACVIGSRKVYVHVRSHSRPHHVDDSSTVEDVLPVFVALMLLLGGIVQPNVISSIYFLTFLFLGTFWACHRSVRFKRNKAFFCLKMLLTLYSALHVTLLYLYQFEFFQSRLSDSSLYARWVYFNILHFVRSSLDELKKFVFYPISSIAGTQDRALNFS